MRKIDDSHSVSALTKRHGLGNASRVKRYKNSHIFIITICIFGIFVNAGGGPIDMGGERKAPGMKVIGDKSTIILWYCYTLTISHYLYCIIIKTT